MICGPAGNALPAGSVIPRAGHLRSSRACLMEKPFYRTRIRGGFIEDAPDPARCGTHCVAGRGPLNRGPLSRGPLSRGRRPAGDHRRGLQRGWRKRLGGAVRLHPVRACQRNPRPLRLSRQVCRLQHLRCHHHPTPSVNVSLSARDGFSPTLSLSVNLRLRSGLSVSVARTARSDPPPGQDQGRHQVPDDRTGDWRRRHRRPSGRPAFRHRRHRRPRRHGQPRLPQAPHPQVSRPPALDRPAPTPHPHPRTHPTPANPSARNQHPTPTPVNRRHHCPRDRSRQPQREPAGRQPRGLWCQCCSLAAVQLAVSNEFHDREGFLSL